MFLEAPFVDALLVGALLTLACLLFILTLVRLAGLRALSKMSAIDFVVTLAAGSLLAQAGTVSNWKSFVQILVALAALFAGQFLFARARRSERVERVAENEPVVLVRDGRFDEEKLRQYRVRKSDVLSKLRGANVGSLSQVRAVVLETTGDISVLHGDAFDPELLSDVRK